ncbi:hypothetical protein Dsin_030650 [Dipteronia sinensis]|uniref:Protein JASON n=1 Tax=Dipteronia sinensis TaxID=43782 RepID=A0AAE0DRJ2_9ROSI|nr:hypothetical protein Dsin_030650 [Dipteronia sinensis]
MICRLLNREIRCICISVVRFLDRSVSSAMGCFFGCFRVRDDRSRLSHSTRPKFSEPVIANNRLSSLFLAEEKEESRCSHRENHHSGSPQIDKGLRDEAKFLKACGTLPETPAEIRKASQKLKGSPHYDESEPSKFNSWLPNTSIKKLQLERQCEQPLTPIKLSEEWGRGSASLEHTPSSCVSNVPISYTEGTDIESGNTTAKVFQANQTDDKTNFVSPWVSGSNFPCKNKSVRFECDFDESSSKGSSGNVNQNSKNYESPGIQSVSKPLPNPTPLKLSDEMQTPGTVFPANIRSLAFGNTQIRSQYVYSVSSTVENVSQWKVLEEDNGSYHLPGERRESSEPENASPKTEVRMKESSNAKDLNVVASAFDDNSKNLASASSKNPYFGRTPGDRPIIGMVAAHWNEDETSNISPKWWDGNGIPNSTNKYKEDQKVSWHATPFEERLEKALSEETIISQSCVIFRKNITQKAMVFDEAEESDTALSRLRPSSNSKSVVSF